MQLLLRFQHHTVLPNDRPHHFLRTACSAAYPPAVHERKSQGDPHVVDAAEIEALGNELLDSWHLPGTDSEFYISSRRGSLMREIDTTVRGTTTLKDWRQDAKFFLVPWEHPGHVHEGFLEWNQAVRGIVSGRLSVTPCS